MGSSCMMFTAARLIGCGESLRSAARARKDRLRIRCEKASSSFARECENGRSTATLHATIPKQTSADTCAARIGLPENRMLITEVRRSLRIMIIGE